MVKRFKGLKRLGAFVLSLVMAASMAVTVAPVENVQAAGTYKLVEGSDNPEFVHSEWRFADALIDAVGIDATRIGVVSKDADSVEYKFAGAYKFKNITYDIHIKFYKVEKLDGSIIDHFPDTNNLINYNTDSGTETLTITKKTEPGRTPVSYLTFRLQNFSDKTWNYNVWLTKTIEGTEQIVSYNDVPIIVGQCYNANRPSESKVEKIRIYSNDNKITTSVPLDKTITYNDTFEGWINFKTSSDGDTGLDSPWHYFLGMGYQNFAGQTDKGYVRGGYSTNNSTGAMEIRMGYKAYSIEYFDPDSRFVASTIPAEEFVPVPVGSAYSKPTTPTGIAAQATFVPSYIKIREIYLGEKENKDVNPEYKVKLEDGTELKAGTILSFEDISKLGTILMDHNVEVELYAVPADTKYTLTYHDSAKIVPTTGADNIVTKQPELVSGSKPNNASSYKKGDIVTGLDGKQYRFDGWFTDDGIFNDEFIFGNTPIIKDTDIYAKWTLYEPPTSTPDEPDSDTPSTGEPIKVEFVTPIGNPPPTQIKHVGDKADNPGAPIDPATLKPGTVIDGHRFEGWYLDKGFTMPYNFDTKLPHSIVLYAKWVRVSPKTGDTTIPAVYYVFGALALAGVGALATKSRKLRK